MDGRSDPFTWNSQLKKGPKTKNARSRNCAGLEILNLLKKTQLYGPFFYGWGSTASRLQPLQAGSLLFTIQFPEIPGAQFINLRRMKG